LARYLSKASFVLFTYPLSNMTRAYFDRVRFYPEKIISVIHAAGGLAFLAHPKQLGIKNKGELEKLIAELIQYGLDGIEVYSSCHSAKESQKYLDIAKKYDLLVSGGSDFHGLLKEHIDMGYMGNAVQLDYAIVERMKERLKKK